MSQRRAEVKRTTTETDISLSLDLDGTGRAEVSTGIGFLDHMLELFAHHGRFDLTVQGRRRPARGRTPHRGGRRARAG